MKSTQTELVAFPSNTVAEQEVLSACIFDPDAADEFLDVLRPDHFYQSAHQKVFAAIQRLRKSNNPVDLVAIADELRKHLELELAGGASSLSRLADIPPATSVEYFSGLIKEAYLRRRIVETGNTLVKNGQRPEVITNDLLGSALSQLTAIDNDSTKASIESLASLSFDATDRYELLQQSSGQIIGIPFGFKDLDAMTCGLQSGDLVIVAARPSMGKTALALNMAQNAAGAGYEVGFFSLEMSRRSLFDRIVSSEAGVNLLKFRSGRFSGEDWGRITAAQEILYELPIFIDDSPGLHYSEVRRRARRMVREHGIKIIFIDYLQLMSGDHKNGRVEEVTSISRNLKGIARELNLPVICLSQLSRSCEQRDKKHPRLSDLRDSGAIEQDADVVAFIYRDEVYNENSKHAGIAEIIIAKQRNGPTGKVRLGFYGKTTSFSEVNNG